ncbi:M56 family metallopeptidase [Symmachiella macrocystis]|nr:M56 family metallopeptidase [Symmachiella macrocystis]
MIIYVLGKLTVLLGAVWVIHFALVRRNPRWRVLLWRGLMLGMILLPVVELLSPSWNLSITSTSAPTPTRIESTVRPETSQQPFPEPTMPNVADVDISAITKSGPPSQSFDRLNWFTSQLMTCFIGFWAIVTFILSVRRVVGSILVRRTIARANPIPVTVRSLFNRLAIDLAGLQKVEVKIAPDDCSPYLAGVLRPVIVIPRRMAESSRRDELRAAAAHELAHLFHRDHLWSQMAGWLSIPLWFHPLVWKLAAAHANACETVADAVAAGHSGGRQAYSHTLARIALTHFGYAANPQYVPMFRTSKITRRLRSLHSGLNAGQLTRFRIRSTIVIGILVLWGLGSMRVVVGEPPNPKPNDDVKRDVGSPATPPKPQVIKLHDLIHENERAEAIAFNPTGELLVTGGWESKEPEDFDDWENGLTPGCMRLWDVKTGRELGRYDGDFGAILGVAFSPNGRLIATAGRMADKPKIGSVKLWDVNTKRIKASLLGHANWVLSTAFSPDGTLLASGGFGGDVKIWDVAAEKLIQTLPRFAGTAEAVTFSPDGKLLAIGLRNGIVNLCNVGSWEVVATLDGSTPIEDEYDSYYLRDTQFSPDGRAIVTAGHLYNKGKGRNDRPGRVRIWDVAKRDLTMELSTGRLQSSAAFSHRGQYVAVGSMSRLDVWNAQSGKQFYGENQQTGSSSTAMSFSPVDSIFAYADGVRRVRIFRVIEE